MDLEEQEEGGGERRGRNSEGVGRGTGRERGKEGRGRGGRVKG